MTPITRGVVLAIAAAATFGVTTPLIQLFGASAAAHKLPTSLRETKQVMPGNLWALALAPFLEEGSRSRSRISTNSASSSNDIIAAL